MAGVTDPNIVHETMAKLDASTIYLESEVEGLVHDYLAHKGNNALTKWITPARDRFRDRERPALDHNNKRTLDELELFRKDVGTFLRQYDFLSQIVDYEDPSLEKLSIYLRHLGQGVSSTFRPAMGRPAQAGRFFWAPAKSTTVQITASPVPP